jgi:hypothetical protein
MLRCSFLLPVLVCVLHAQDLTPAYTPLTLGEQYRFAFNKTFGGGAIATVMFKSSLDQLRDSPGQWGTNADSFATRAASHFGRSFLRQNIAFGVRALDGEDPRYFASGREGVWNRTKYALSRTFVVHNAQGGWMPAYSLFVSGYATPFMVNEWRPERRSVPLELRTGTVSIGIAAASNVFQEFWPDAKKRLHRH